MNTTIIFKMPEKIVEFEVCKPLNEVEKILKNGAIPAILTDKHTEIREVSVPYTHERFGEIFGFMILCKTVSYIK